MFIIRPVRKRKGILMTSAALSLFFCLAALICPLYTAQYCGNEYIACATDEDAAGEGVTADSLTVKLGYAGGKYETLKTYSIAEIEALGTIDQIFTWITRVNGCVLQSTRGVSLKRILEDAGIDLKSVARIHFTCSDLHETEELTIGYLFDQKKYYYPNLIKTWNYDEGKAGAGADEGKVEVETVLALLDYWKKTISNEDEPEPYENMIPDKRLRLSFGMTDTERATSFNSAKWISQIEVTLAGTPPKDKDKDKAKKEEEKKKDSAAKDKKKGSEKGDKNKDKDKASGQKNQTGKSEAEEVEPEAPLPSVPQMPSMHLTELETDVSGAGAGRDGYQPWRENEMSEDAEAYTPYGDDAAAGPVAGAMGGLIVIGGAMHYIHIRRFH